MKKKKYKVIKPEDYTPTKLLLGRQEEIEDERKIEATFELTMLILTDLYLLNRGNTKKKQQLRKLTKSITQKELQEAYWKMANQQTLNYRSKHRQSDKEKLFHQQLSKYTRRNYYHSFWIGNHCNDLFFPRYRLVIEIDGSVHLEEYKMRKDDHKEEFLKLLGIPVKRISNYEAINRYFTHINQLNSLRSYNTNSTRRLMRRIYIATIATHCNLLDLEDLFNINFLLIAKKIYYCDLINGGAR